MARRGTRRRNQWRCKHFPMAYGPNAFSGVTVFRQISPRDLPEARRKKLALGYLRQDLLNQMESHSCENLLTRMPYSASREASFSTMSFYSAAQKRLSRIVARSSAAENDDDVSGLWSAKQYCCKYGTVVRQLLRQALLCTRYHLLQKSYSVKRILLCYRTQAAKPQSTEAIALPSFEMQCISFRVWRSRR